MNYFVPQDELIKERLKLIYSSIYISNIGMIITGIILVYVLRNDISSTKLSLWLLALVLTSITTLIHKYLYTKATKTGLKNPKKWENIFVTLVITFGLIWGSAAFFLFPRESIINQTFLELTIVGVVAGSIGLLSPSLKAVLGFMILCTIPLIISIVSFGTINQFTITALILMYLIVSMVNGFKYNKRISKQISLQNESLVREKLLKESEDKYRILYEYSEDAMMLFVDYQFNMANKAAVKAFGFDSLEELLNVKPFETSPKFQPDGIKSIKKAIGVTKILKAVGFCRMEWVYKRKDGEERTADVTMTVVPYEEGKAVFCIMRDIEEIKKIQKSLIVARKESEAANRSKSDFLANMSHEIRTPMNGVIGINNLMLKHPLDKEQKQRALAIKSSADSMLAVINDILDFSKIEAGQLNIENIEFNFEDFILDFSSSIENRIHAKKLKYQCNIDPELANWYLGDSLRIRQVLTNLIDNAVKFTPSGKITLDCKVVKNTKDYSEIKIEVKDTGIGISDVQQSAIFNRFVQADGSTSRKFGGTGLGLSICQQLTKLMDGDIGFESKIDKGTTFWIVLTLKKLSLSQAESLTNKYLKSEIKPIDATILVADDNQINQMVVQGMLEMYGIHVDLVDDGSQALKAILEKQYDMILMDCHMPIMDGYEATQKIRQLADKNLKEINIVAVTASAMQGDKEKCLQSGMNDYLSKPIEFDSLHEILNRYLTS